MAYSTNIASYSLSNPAWVLSIATGDPNIYFSNVPIANLSGEKACISRISLPSKEVDKIGGGTKVGTLTVELQDILLSDSSYAVTKYMYDTAIIGCQVTLYLGFKADNWDGESAQTNFVPIFMGYLREADFENGIWKLKCEDGLSKAKNCELKYTNGYFKVRDDYLPKDEHIHLQTRVGFPSITKGSDLVENGDWEHGATTHWTAVNTYAASFKVDTATPAPYAGTYRGEFRSASATSFGYIYQDIALPETHIPGHIYGLTARIRTKSTTSGDQYARVSLQGMDVSNNVYEMYHGQSRRVSETEWQLRSATIAIYDPNTTKIRIAIHGLTSGSEIICVDNVNFQRLDYVAACKRELIGLVSMTEATTPNTLTISHGLNCTRENQFAKDTKGQLVKVLTGYAADVILRLLTSTSGGGNGDWDFADGYGAGIPVAMIDTATFTGTRTTTTLGTLSKISLVVTKDESDCLDLIDKEILKPLGMWLTTNKRGKIVLKWLPYTFAADANKALTDAKSWKKPTLERKVADSINEITYLCDYDTQEAVETPNRQDEYTNKKKHKKIETSTSISDDPNYVGKFVLDEKDYLMSGVYKDSNLSLQTLFGKKPVTIKSQAVRSWVSTAYGGNSPQHYDANNYSSFHGEELGRSFAERVLGWYSTPPSYVTWYGFAPMFEYEVGDMFTVTSSYIPDMADGTMGISAVNGIVTKLEPDARNLTVVATIILVGWALAIAADVYSHTADLPDANTISSSQINTEVINAGNFPWTLVGNFNAIRTVQTYDGTQGSVPTIDYYKDTEVQMCYDSDGSYSDSYGAGYNTVARYDYGRWLTAIDGMLSKVSDRDGLTKIAMRYRYRFTDGTASSWYTVTGIESDVGKYYLQTPNIELKASKPEKTTYRVYWDSVEPTYKYLKVWKRAYSVTPGTPDTDGAWNLAQTHELQVDVNPGTFTTWACLVHEWLIFIHHNPDERVMVACQLIDELGNVSHFGITHIPGNASDDNPDAHDVENWTLTNAVVGRQIVFRSAGYAKSTHVLDCSDDPIRTDATISSNAYNGQSLQIVTGINPTIGTGYYIQLNATTLKLYKKNDSTHTELDSHTQTLAADTWYDIMLELTSTGVNGYLNGNNILASTDTTYTTSTNRYAGFANVSGSYYPRIRCWRSETASSTAPYDHISDPDSAEWTSSATSFLFNAISSCTSENVLATTSKAKWLKPLPKRGWEVQGLFDISALSGDGYYILGIEDPTGDKGYRVAIKYNPVWTVLNEAGDFPYDHGTVWACDDSGEGETALETDAGDPGANSKCTKLTRYEDGGA